MSSNSFFSSSSGFGWSFAGTAQPIAANSFSGGLPWALPDFTSPIDGKDSNQSLSQQLSQQSTQVPSQTLLSSQVTVAPSDSGLLSQPTYATPIQSTPASQPSQSAGLAFDSPQNTTYNTPGESTTASQSFQDRGLAFDFSRQECTTSFSQEAKEFQFRHLNSSMFDQRSPLDILSKSGLFVSEPTAPDQWSSAWSLQMTARRSPTRGATDRSRSRTAAASLVRALETHDNKMGVNRGCFRPQRRALIPDAKASRRSRLSREVEQSRVIGVLNRAHGRSAAKTQMPILGARRFVCSSAISDDIDHSDNDDSVASMTRATQEMTLSQRSEPDAGDSQASPQATGAPMTPERMPSTSSFGHSMSLFLPQASSSSPLPQSDLHTPSPVGHRQVDTPPRGTPPPRPCQWRRIRELNNEVSTAIETRSMPLLSMALLRNHCTFCPGDHEIHEAINIGHVRALAYLLEHGRDVEAPCSGIRPLLRAVRAPIGDLGHQMVNLLLRHGADPNAASQDAEQDRPLHDAARHGNAELTASLLAYGANPNELDGAGYTALHNGCHQMYSYFDGRVVDLLLEYGADPRRLDVRCRRPDEYLVGEALTPTRTRLQREVNWWNRRAVVLAYYRTSAIYDGNIVSRLPFLMFQLVVKFL